MVSIKVNDIFDELIGENKRLLNELLFANQCLDVLNRLKTHLNLCFNQLSTNLSLKDLKIFFDLDNEYNEVMHKKQKSINDSIDELKCEQNIGLNKINPNLSENNRKSSDESIVSKTIKQNNKNKTKKLAKLKPKIELNPNPNSRKISNDNEVNKCPQSDCNQTFRTRTAVTRHYKSVHSLVNSDIVCDFIGCGKAFKSMKSFRTHSLIHSSEAKFICHFDGCDYRTIRKDNFESHINGHLGLRPFKCTHGLCGKTFKLLKQMKSHIKHIHPIERRFKCDFTDCNKVFKNQNNLYIHKKTHESGPLFHCSQPNCQFSANFMSIVRAHQKTHSSERRYVCLFPGCDKTYKGSSGLLDHTQSCHNAEPIFKCLFEGCDKVYKTRNQLTKHKWIHTNRELSCEWPGCDFTTKLTKNLWLHKKIHDSERRFVCHWPACDKRFKDKVHLKTHLRIHNNDKKFVCHWPGCQYRCTENGNLIKHMRIHQKKKNLNKNDIKVFSKKILNN